MISSMFVAYILWKIFQWSTNNRISFVHFWAKFQLQSVMCICNLCNPTEQGITLSLLTISFKRSVGFFKYWSSFLMVMGQMSGSGQFGSDELGQVNWVRWVRVRSGQILIASSRLRSSGFEEHDGVILKIWRHPGSAQPKQRATESL